MSRETDERTTPQYLFDALNSIFSFSLDAAATSANAKCPRYFTKEDNALTQDWRPYVVFVNPPYSRGHLIKWVRKASTARTLVVMLLPADTSTRWFEAATKTADVLHFCRGRFKFSNDNAAKFGTLVAAWAVTPGARQQLGELIPGFTVSRDPTTFNLRATTTEEDV